MCVWLQLVAVVLAATRVSCLVCDDPREMMTGTCAQLSKDLERALLQDEGNMFRLRRAFYYSPTAAPVLLKVVYNTTFGENVINWTTFEQGATPCSSESVNSTTEFVQRNITYGWTSSGVYTVFHPTVLAMMQAQFPIGVLRFYHAILQHRSPEADTFVWDPVNEVPTLHLNMHITSLSCIPSQQLFESVLTDFNTLLKVYAGQQNALTLNQDYTALGFTLPNTSVSVSGVSPSGSDTLIFNLYTSIMCLLYAVMVHLFFRHYYPTHKHKIGAAIRKSNEIVAGIVITAILSTALELPGRLISCISFTVHINNNAKGLFLAVWLPQLFLILTWVFTNIYYHVRLFAGRPSTENDIDRSHNPCIRYLFDGVLKLLLHNIYGHIVILLCTLAFGLLYCLPPAFILIFAYPTQVVAIVTFILAFLFAMIIFTAILIKLYKRLVPKPRRKQRWKTIKFVILKFVPFLLAALYLFCVIFYFFYTLLVGRGSVVSSGPLFLLSVLPSVLLSGVTWIAKRTVLERGKTKRESGDTYLTRAAAEHSDVLELESRSYVIQNVGNPSSSESDQVELEINPTCSSSLS